MATKVIEGTWDEIKGREAELIGHRLRVTITAEHSKPRDPISQGQQATLGGQPLRPISAMGKYAGILSSDDFLRQKQEEIELEERARA